MSVKVRPYRNGGWEVDIQFRLPDGTRHRERYKAPVESKSGALRWGQDRERHLLQHGPEPEKKEVPTLEEFAPKFLEGHAKADRHKPSGVASKESILRIHLIPVLGSQKLDAITNAQVQRLKLHLTDKAAKTVNNVLTVLSVMLKTAIEWEMIDQLPCSIRLLPVARRDAAFHDFGAYERLLNAALSIDSRTYLIALLGGEGGMRVGEIVALEWADIDLDRRQISIRHSDWRGQLTTPKNGRGRFVAMTERVATALRKHRHLRGSRVLCKDDGQPITRQGAWSRVRYAAHRADVRPHPASHVLLAPGDAGCGDAVGAGTGGSPGSDDDPAVFAPESGRVDRRCPAARDQTSRPRAWRNTGDGGRPRAEVEVLEQDSWLGVRDALWNWLLTAA